MSAVGLIVLGAGALMVYAGLTGEHLIDRLRTILSGDHSPAGLPPNAVGSGQATGTATGGSKAL